MRARSNHEMAGRSCPVISDPPGRPIGAMAACPATEILTRMGPFA
jgi:hypothetical protein